MQNIELDCSLCRNSKRFACLIYGSDQEKAVRECAKSDYRYFDKIRLNGTKYKCIESFRARVCQNEVPTDDYMMIEKGSVWTVDKVFSDFVGKISMVKDGTMEELGITWGTLGVFFKKLEE